MKHKYKLFNFLLLDLTKENLNFKTHCFVGSDTDEPNMHRVYDYLNGLEVNNGLKVSNASVSSSYFTVYSAVKPYLCDLPLPSRNPDQKLKSAELSAML